MPGLCPADRHRRSRRHPAQHLAQVQMSPGTRLPHSRGGGGSRRHHGRAEVERALRLLIAPLTGRPTWIPERHSRASRFWGVETQSGSTSRFWPVGYGVFPRDFCGPRALDRAEVGWPDCPRVQVECSPLKQGIRLTDVKCVCGTALRVLWSPASPQSISRYKFRCPRCEAVRPARGSIVEGLKYQDGRWQRLESRSGQVRPGEAEGVRQRPAPSATPRRLYPPPVRLG